MKRVIFKMLGVVIAAVLFSGAAYGQFDDVYYNPGADDDYHATSLSKSSSNYYDEESYDDRYYDDDSYDHFDDYDYYYTSRIKRFHRPYRGFGFYDPCYVDRYYYDPFAFSYNHWYPGSSIYISFGNPWNSWNRWQHWNRHSYWGDPYYRYYSYNYWNRPSWAWNNYNYGYYGYNSYNYSGYNNYYYNGYCPTPVANIYNVYNPGTFNSNPNGTHYGPRTTGTVKSSPRGLTDDKSVRDINKDGKINGIEADPSFRGTPEDTENPVVNRRPSESSTGEKEGVRTSEADRIVPAQRGQDEQSPRPDRTVREETPVFQSPDRRQPADVRRNEPTQRETRPDRTPERYNPPKEQPRERQRYTPPKRDNTPERNYNTPSRTREQRDYTPSRRSAPDNNRLQQSRSRSSSSYDSGSRSSGSSNRSYNSSRSSSNRSSSGGSSPRSRRGGGED